MTCHRAAVNAGPGPAVFFDLLTPREPSGRPHVVMLHGGSHTGSCYLLTADQRPGWAPYFAARGYHVAVPDWPGHGRSGAIDLTRLTGEQVCQGLAAMIASLGGPVVLLAHSMGGALGWRIAELCGRQIVAIVAIAPGAPGNLAPEPEIESEDADGLVVRTAFRTITLSGEGPSIADRSFVVDKLVGGSSRFPREYLDGYARSLTATGSRLLYERANVRGSQVRMDDPRCLDGMPIMIVTGSEDLDHPRDADGALADWLSAQGASVEFAWLPERGINGNGHMLMLERNSDEIATLVIDWLERHHRR